jgi:hypothetical protein
MASEVPTNVQNRLTINDLSFVQKARVLVTCGLPSLVAEIFTISGQTRPLMR